MTFEATLTTGIVACAGAIVFLFKMFLSDRKETRRLLQICETERTKLSLRLAVLEAPNEAMKIAAVAAAAQLIAVAKEVADSLRSTVKENGKP